jgi:hypothetical protein
MRATTPYGELLLIVEGPSERTLHSRSIEEPLAIIALANTPPEVFSLRRSVAIVRFMSIVSMSKSVRSCESKPIAV